MPSINKTKTTKKNNAKSLKKKISQTYTANNKDIHTEIAYPTTVEERAKFVNPSTNRVVTEFQYKVFDLVAQIPKGHVTSYKVLSDTLKSAPRAIGQALRLNPFNPLPVACHRVIAADFSIGGFGGKHGDCQNTANKKAMLELEGCVFDEDYLFNNNVDGKKSMFKDFK